MSFGKFETKKWSAQHTTDNSQVQKCLTNKREIQTLALSDRGWGRQTDREAEGYGEIDRLYNRGRTHRLRDWKSVCVFERERES